MMDHRREKKRQNKTHHNQKCIHHLITLYLNLKPAMCPECFLMERQKGRRGGRDEGEIKTQGDREKATTGCEEEERAAG